MSRSRNISDLISITELNGNIGINETNPGTALHVKKSISSTYTGGNTNITNSIFNVTNTYGTPTANAQANIQIGIYDGTYNRVTGIAAIAESASNRKASLVFWTDDENSRSEKLRIDSAGRLVVKSTSPMNMSGDAVVQIGDDTALWQYNSTNSHFSRGLYYDSGYKFTGTDNATWLSMNDEGFIFRSSINTPTAGTDTGEQQNFKVNSSTGAIELQNNLTIATLASGAPAGSIAYVTDDGGNLYYKGSAGWKAFTAKVGTQGSPASSSTHPDITSEASGWFYFVSPNGGNEWGYVYNDYDGGGWLNVMTINSAAIPGHSYAGMWDDTGFWTGTTMYGTSSESSTDYWNGFYKSWAWMYYTAFNEIMIQVLDSSGSVIAYGVYDRLSGFSGQSWYNMMSPGSRQVITGTRKAQSGSSGATSNSPQSTAYGFPFTDPSGQLGCQNEAITINDTNQKFSADTATQTRIGTTASSDSPTNRGHVVAGGMGVFHRHGGWYGGHVVGPIMDYCTNAGGATGYRNWGNAGSSSNNTWNWYGASSWADDCITESNEYATRIVRILVR